MKDRISTQTATNGAKRYGKYNASGTLIENVYLALNDAPSENGTPLNKANLLDDTTTNAIFGSTADKTVNQALNQLQTNINTKVTANTALTAGATKCKITYDTKGLVTGGNDLSASDIPDLNASKITAGTFDAGRIPSLSADKITSGTLGTDRIPNLSADKINSGILGADRIPSLGAGKITSGTFDSARIPELSADKITSGTFTTDRIPELAQSKITNLETDLASKATPSDITTALNARITYGTTELTPGTSTLATGALYVVY